MIDLGDKLGTKEWRMNNLYFIKTKEKKLNPMALNFAQRDYLLRRALWNFILKARQLGFSTFCLIDLLDDTIFTPNVNSAIIAHEKQKVVVLFEIVKRAFDGLPKELQPRVSLENRNELYFPDLDSKIYVTMDTRGETVHNLHVSELAFIRRADERLAATLESVPVDGKITFETTANGMANFAYDEWTDPLSQYRKFFYNWMWEPGYRMRTDKSMDQLREEYQSLAVQFNLIKDAIERFEMDEQQVAFYISKIKRHKKLTTQEYPLTDLEAFIASGRGVFNIQDLNKHITSAPIAREFQDLLIWEQPLQGFRYVVGVDSAEGNGNDNAVIEVLNAYTGEQAAEFASNDIAPGDLGDLSVRVAKKYNNALIVPEINNTGVSTVDRIKRKYVNVYMREVMDKRTRQTSQSVGWRTTGVSKPKLVVDLEEAVRDEFISINSEEAVKECQTFVKTDEPGKQGYGAEGTKKDDRVMALGLAYQGIKFLPKQKPPKNVAQQKLKEWIERQNLSKQFPQEQVNNILAQRKKRYHIRGVK